MTQRYHYTTFFTIRNSFEFQENDAQLPADLVTFTEEIVNGKLHFWCSVCVIKHCRDIKTNDNQYLPK